jgi:3-methyladenine DNA glycosylase AlkD
MFMQHQHIIDEMIALGDAEQAQHSQRFFKTGEGEYGYGDQFLGIRVPEVRRLVKKYRSAAAEAVQLLESPWHEVRLLALLLMVEAYKRGSIQDRARIFNSYISNTDRINNWDLVDVTAHHIVGAWLWDKNRSLLYDFARSESLWERRIAILSTLYFIRKDDFVDTLAIAALLLNDPEDLMHKATGWMLREVGKRDEGIMEGFLAEHALWMPRTALRYAIERLPEDRRLYWLHLK